jgi:hypothetical protein
MLQFVLLQVQSCCSSDAQVAMYTVQGPLQSCARVFCTHGGLPPNVCPFVPCPCSPLGKVPAVTYSEGGEQRVLYESLVLVNWVDEYYAKEVSVV